MSEPRPSKEELTTAMHGELSVSQDTDRKFIVFAALDCIEDGTFSEAEAMETYNISAAELELHKAEYYSLV